MPTLRETLDRLLELQKVDRERDKIAKAVRDLDTGKAVEAEATAAYDAWQSASAALQKAQGDLKDAELELSSVEKKIKSFEQKMSGGQSINARELLNIEKEINQLTRQRATLDDRILTLMDQAESLQVTAAHADATSKQKEEHRKVVLEELSQRRRLLDSQLMTVSEQRQGAHARVEDPTLLAKYEAMRSKPTNAGVVIAKAVENTCGGCHMQAASQDIKRAADGVELTLCPNCGRIMA